MNCACVEQLNARMKEQSMPFQISPDVLPLSVGVALEQILVIPLARLDKRKLRASDPKYIVASHCPFCGKETKS